jgi:hypothetical protein
MNESETVLFREDARDLGDAERRDGPNVRFTKRRGRPRGPDGLWQPPGRNPPFAEPQ